MGRLEDSAASKPLATATATAKAKAKAKRSESQKEPQDTASVDAGIATSAPKTSQSAAAESGHTNRPKVKVTTKVSVAPSPATESVEDARKSYGQVRKSVLFLVLVTVLYGIYIVFSGQFDEFVGALAGVDTGWLIAGAFAYFTYYFLGILAYIISVITDPNCPVGIRDLMSVEAAGIFFMNLTPNGAGAAPAQIFRLTRAGISVGQAGALQFTRFVMYEAGEGIFAALILLFRFNYFFEQFGDVTIVGVVLFGAKILMVGGMLAICLLPRMVIAVGNWGLRVLSRFNIVKRYDHWYEIINTQVHEFSSGFKNAAKNVPEMLAVLVITLFQLGCLYSLPYFVLHALGQPADLLTCLASGSMLELLTSAIPLPGGTGGAEGGFAFLFGHMFGEKIAAGFVLWRAIEYFLPTLFASMLLGLRSHGGPTVYRRWTQAVSSLSAFISGEKRLGQKKPASAGGIRVKMGAKAKKK